MQRSPLAATAKATTTEHTTLHWTGYLGPTLPAALDPVSRRHEEPSPQCLQRVQRDLAELAHHPPPGAFIEPEEEDITTIHAIIVGPDGTPYEGGFFHFMLKCPQDYPVAPPLARIMTTDSGLLAFNPNLCSNAERLYNDNLRFHTLRVAVCDAVEACLLGTAPYQAALREAVLARFAENYAKYEKAVGDPHASSLLGTVLGVLNDESKQYKVMLPRLKALYGHYKHGLPLAAVVRASMDEQSERLWTCYHRRDLPPIFDPVSHRHEQPSPQCLLRVERDLAELVRNPLPGVFVEPEEKDITTIHAIVVGPEGTPYEGGFFHFMLKCPQDYPVKPLLARIMTTDNGQQQFNSNLYANGMVGLSILDTIPGPPWSSEHTLKYVLVSIQSLFNDWMDGPLKGHVSCNKVYLRCSTLRVAVCDAVEACLLGTAPYPPALRETVLAHFAESCAKYKEEVNACHGSGVSTYMAKRHKVLRERLQDLSGRVLKNASHAEKET
ncbi:hypothetical protein HPB49_022759 [Dermacentor silvarum]|uniref:Uncharacterized protein n=1 Tax=Dermacentor silvarum TaxID=543639 RepID=A0ACB8D8Q6_DERSI|nr:hypothetical protein HPB49_022759 [Dermacentor silvarum]